MKSKNGPRTGLYQIHNVIFHLLGAQIVSKGLCMMRVTRTRQSRRGNLDFVCKLNLYKQARIFHYILLTKDGE